MTRQFNKYKKLFKKYEELDFEQKVIFGENIYLPKENKEQWDELQVKKIAILDEMARNYEF
ncbi:MAG: hypothetical protein WCY09_10405 [Candidatus Omnitrophota bacterium]|jgi:hypothetical protein